MAKARSYFSWKTLLPPVIIAVVIVIILVLLAPQGSVSSFRYWDF